MHGGKKCWEFRLPHQNYSSYKLFWGLFIKYKLNNSPKYKIFSVFLAYVKWHVRTYMRQISGCMHATDIHFSLLTQLML